MGALGGDRDGLDVARLLVGELLSNVLLAGFTEEAASFGGAGHAGELDLLFLSVFGVESTRALLDGLQGEADLVVVLDDLGLLDGL